IHSHPGAGAPARTELTRISGPAVGAPPRCYPPHPFAPGGGYPYKDRANEDIGTCCRSTASVRTATSIRTRGGCPYKDRANEENGICCRSTASVRKPPAPFAPGPGGLRPASAHSKVHADPLPVDLVHADIHLVEIAQHLVTDDLLRGSLIHGPAPAHGNDVIGVAGGEVDVVQNHHH